MSPRGERRWLPASARLVAAPLALVALMFAGATQPGGRALATVPAITLRPCMIAAYTPARCGTLLVDENPGDLGGKRIPIKVAVVKATSGKAKPDPVFWFAGWGSAGASDDAPGVISAFVSVNQDRDIVFIDQRGTGSSRLACRLPDRGKLLGSGALALVTAAARTCAARIGPNLRHYTTAVAVDDFDKVRAALGYDKIDIYGGSYGVTSGQVYLLRHGEHVRTAVFDSGSLLDVRIFERAGPNAQRALDLLLARCDADSACHAAFPDLRRELARVTARLARGPLAIPGSSVPLTPLTFASALGDLIAYTPGKAAVPRLIHLVATGRLARATALVPPTQPRGGNEELAYQMLIQCSEPWASWRPAEVSRLSAGTFRHPVDVWNAGLVGAACKAFPKVKVPAAIGERVHSNVPILFLSGNEDPADPPANIADARRELPNSRTVVFAAAGHGQLGLPCAQTLIGAFFERGSARGLATGCARTAAVRPFDVAP